MSSGAGGANKRLQYHQKCHYFCRFTCCRATLIQVCEKMRGNQSASCCSGANSFDALFSLLVLVYDPLRYTLALFGVVNQCRNAKVFVTVYLFKYNAVKSKFKPQLNSFPKEFM